MAIFSKTEEELSVKAVTLQSSSSLLTLTGSPTKITDPSLDYYSEAEEFLTFLHTEPVL